MIPESSMLVRPMNKGVAQAVDPKGLLDKAGISKADDSRPGNNIASDTRIRNLRRSSQWDEGSALCQ